MKISTKGRYGLRAMVDLAANSSGGYVSISSIADRQGLSENYMEQVFSSLKKAGLLKSVKGSQGGYILGTAPSEITVGQILTALEGELNVVDKDTEEKNGKNDVESIIQTFVWNKINESIKEIVNSTTLQMLIDEYRRASGNEALMYYI